MPSIKQLFGGPDDVEAGEGEFDLDKFFAEVDTALATKSSLEIANEAMANGEPVVSRETSETPPPPAEPVEPVAPVVEPVEIPPAAAIDPLTELPADRRAALLAIDQLLTTDPQRRDAIFRAMNGVQEAPAPLVEPEPELPPDIDPNSFEARIWRENQDTRRAVAEMSANLQRQQLSLEQSRAANEAQAAARAFGAKHPELEESDVFEIARFAGNSGIAGAFVEANRNNPQAALMQSFESVLYANEDFRSKVIATPAPVVPGETPKALDRKAKLTALSSAASPVASGSASRQALETRPDGRLTPASRQQAVAEVAAGLLRQRQGY